ncbi:transcription factor ABORTED MICROSPORES-like protein isoform X1 [Cinnamomum micranthum f. kanehirae]|uniref:Transcription factor ABORTED MICROSPORES-like protein isoform X1 n=1 Tax=Cinnamomum micranthum f. kanehirae TaxID=337451 RepID=A0A3S3LXG3_9MAGN|nr:transcription factor ABORTED MICROSPORES-like protein isoform X1 [Cinnamomum micranthum f. kanehirae]
MRKLQVPEEGHITEFVMAHCSPSWEQEAMLAGNGRADTGLDGPCLNNGFTGDNPIDHQLEPFPSNGYETESNTKSWVPPTNDNSSLPRDLSVDQIRLCNSSLNFFGASLPPTDDRPKNDIFLEGSLDSIHKPHSFSYSAMDDGFPDTSALQQSIGIVTPNLHPSLAESSVTKELGQDKDSIKQDMGQSNSISDCSDQMEEDDGYQSKHYVAERKRREKLNKRLYFLRSLVPKISRMDRASILGDAIEFVKELQKQVKDLQDELEETQVGGEQKENCNNNDNVQLEVPNQNVASHGDGESPNGLKTGMADQETRCSSSNKTGDFVKHNHDLISTDKALQMEVQVEASQVDGNELFLKVFWEQKPARFVRLMEAINSLGLEVTNANVTTFRGLVLNVFKVKKRENEVVEADQARDSLLELICNPKGGRPESGCIGENGGSGYDHHHHS